MNNLAIDQNSQSKLNNFNNRASLKLLVFEVEALTLALPILQVQKVVRYNPLHGSGLSYVKLAHLGDREVAIIDLHQKLFKVSLPQSSQNQGYFIISKKII